MRVFRTDVKAPSTNLQKKASYPVSYAVEGQLGGYAGFQNPSIYIREGYVKNTNVYSIIQLIAQQYAKAQFSIINKKKEKEVKDHPILELIYKPNQFQSKSEFLENVCGFYDLTGECFIYAPVIPVGRNKGRPLSMQTLPPQYTEVKINKTTMIPTPQSYVYRHSSVKHEIGEEDMIYLRRWNPNGGIRGISAMASAIRTLVHDNDAVEANMRIIRNGGPKGILSFEDGEYDQTQVDAAKRAYHETYSGAQNFGKPMFLGTKVSWVELGAKVEDLGIYQGRVMSMRDMCNVFNICSQLLNDPENKTYANMAEARKALITQCVLPRLTNFCDIINREIMPVYDPTGNECLTIDKSCFEELAEDQVQLVTSLNMAWWITGNEKRKRMSLPEGKGAEWDAAMVPAGLLPLHIGGEDLSEGYEEEENEPEENED